MFTRDIAMTPGGDEIYFCVAVGNYAVTTILFTRQIDGRWTAPEVMPHMDRPGSMNLEPCISPDGKSFFFFSDRPDSAAGENVGDEDLWVMRREGDAWGPPQNLGPPVNTDNPEFFPSVTRDGTLYFTRGTKGSRVEKIYRSRLVGGRYQEPEELPAQVNCGTTRFNAFIDPDERYIVVPAIGREDSQGGVDYYVVFRDSTDHWSEPVNLGPLVNTEGNQEYSPFVSRDGRYFFFMSARKPTPDQMPARLTYRSLVELQDHPENGLPSIYWMDAGFLEDLRATAVW
jgi:Tol biopolymer transport system component